MEGSSLLTLCCFAHVFFSKQNRDLSFFFVAVDGAVGGESAGSLFLIRSGGR